MEMGHTAQGITGPNLLHSINDFCSPPWQKENIAGHLYKQLSTSLTVAPSGLSSINGDGMGPNR